MILLLWSSAPAGKPDVWRGVRDTHSGHGRDRIFHAEGLDPIAPRGFRGVRTGRQGTGIQAVRKEGCNASSSFFATSIFWLDRFFVRVIGLRKGHAHVAAEPTGGGGAVDEL